MIKIIVNSSGEFYSFGEYVSGTVGKDIVTLDGVFRVADLKEIILFMEGNECSS